MWSQRSEGIVGGSQQAVSGRPAGDVTGCSWTREEGTEMGYE